MPALREIVEAWASFYASSPAARSVVAFTHVGSIVVGGGSAIAADLGTLRALRRDGPTLGAELDRLRATHRMVTTSLALVVLSGLLLMLADLDAYVASRAFWIKMGLFAGLLLNGATIVATTASAAGDGGPRVPLRLATIASVILWLAATLLGTVVPNAI